MSWPFKFLTLVDAVTCINIGSIEAAARLEERIKRSTITKVEVRLKSMDLFEFFNIPHKHGVEL